MKIRAFTMICVAGATLLAGVAFAQAANPEWPQIELKDLERCRPVIQQVHWLEQAHIRKLIERDCGSRTDAADACKSARRWLTETQTKDDGVWFFEGNDRCSGGDYPCFGVQAYNTARTGEEAARWEKMVLAKAAQSYGVTPGMDFSATAAEADKCVAGIWAAKYQDAPADEGQAPVAGQAPGIAAGVKAAEPVAAVDAVKSDTEARLALQASKELAAGPSAHAVAASECADMGVAAGKRIDQCSAALAALKPEAAGYEELLTLRMSALLTAGRNAEAIADGDQLAARKPAGEAKLASCRIRVLARRELDKALVACYSTGNSSDPAMLELRGRVHMLAGRYQEAHADFNAALAAGDNPAALYLRGLAFAGLGKISEAVKDLAKAEEAKPGIAATYEAWGYTLAATASGKPLVDPSALSGAPDAGPAEPRPVLAVAPPAAKPDVTPDAVAEKAAPARVKADEAVAPASAPASKMQEPPGPPPPLKPTATPTIPAVDSASRAPAAAGATLASAVAGSAVAAPGETTPPATACIMPLQQSDVDNPVGADAFRNTCDYPVRFTFCVSQPAIGTDVEMFACGKDARFRTDTIAAQGVQRAEVARQIAYFACRSPSLPEVAYSDAKGLEGYCR